MKKQTKKKLIHIEVDSKKIFKKINEVVTLKRIFYFSLLLCFIWFFLKVIFNWIDILALLFLAILRYFTIVDNNFKFIGLLFFFVVAWKVWEVICYFFIKGIKYLGGKLE